MDRDRVPFSPGNVAALLNTQACKTLGCLHIGSSGWQRQVLGQVNARQKTKKGATSCRFHACCERVRENAAALEILKLRSGDCSHRIVCLHGCIRYWLMHPCFVRRIIMMTMIVLALMVPMSQLASMVTQIPKVEDTRAVGSCDWLFSSYTMTLITLFLRPGKEG